MGVRQEDLKDAKKACDEASLKSKEKQAERATVEIQLDEASEKYSTQNEVFEQAREEQTYARDQEKLIADGTEQLPLLEAELKDARTKEVKDAKKRNPLEASLHSEMTSLQLKQRRQNALNVKNKKAEKELRQEMETTQGELLKVRETRVRACIRFELETKPFL